jgi:hypothetical protein
MLMRPRRTQNLPLPDGHETYTGDLTYYSPALGACGITSSDKDAVVAVSHYTFDAVQKGTDPNQNPLCNRKIRATRVNEKTGESSSIDVTVIDRCECYPVPEVMRRKDFRICELTYFRYWMRTY